MHMVEESRLVQEAQEGSEEAFRQLVRMHQAAVQGYLGRFIPNLDVVEDIAQESFLKAYKSLKQFRGDSSFRVWLFAIARNEALMHLRQERTRRSLESSGVRDVLERWMGERAEEETAGPDAHESRLLALETCLKNLAGHSASLVEQHYVKGVSIGTLARDVGKSEVAVRVILLRIRQALRECIRLRVAATGANS